MNIALNMNYLIRILIKRHLFDYQNITLRIQRHFSSDKETFYSKNFSFLVTCSFTCDHFTHLRNILLIWDKHLKNFHLFISISQLILSSSSRARRRHVFRIVRKRTNLWKLERFNATFERTCRSRRLCSRSSSHQKVEAEKKAKSLNCMRSRSKIQRISRTEASSYCQ